MRGPPGAAPDRREPSRPRALTRAIPIFAVPAAGSFPVLPAGRWFSGLVAKLRLRLSGALLGIGLAASLPLPTSAVPATNCVIGETSIGTDLAIQGRGMFLVRPPDSLGLRLTRDGQFRVDSDGYLITWMGSRVQGFVSEKNRTVADVMIYCRDCAADEFVKSFSIDAFGKIRLSTTRDRSPVIGQVLLVWHPSLEVDRTPLGPSNLTEGYLVPADISAELSRWEFRPGDSPVGTLVPSALESAVETELEPLSSTTTAPGDAAYCLRTSRATDLAIVGDGWFLLRDPMTDEAFLTRSGVFRINPDGYLETPEGLRLMAYPQSLTTPSIRWIGSYDYCDARVRLYWARRNNASARTDVYSFYIAENGDLQLWGSDASMRCEMSVAVVTPEWGEKLPRRDATKFTVPPQASLYLLPSVPNPGSSMSRGLVVSGCLDLRQLDDSLRREYPKLRDFTQGAVQRSKTPSHLAVSGRGFFIVREPVTSKKLATRAGCFEISEQGYFELPGGYRLQGEDFNNPDSEALVDLRAVNSDPSGIFDAPAVGRVTFGGVTSEGIIRNEWSDGSSVPIAIVRLQSFVNPDALREIVPNPCGDVPVDTSPTGGLDPATLVHATALFDGYEEALPQSPGGIRPGTAKTGLLQSSAREQDYAIAGRVIPSVVGRPAFRLRHGLAPLRFRPEVEWSEDLQTWHPFTGLYLPTANDAVLVDTTSTDASTSPPTRRFYRALVHYATGFDGPRLQRPAAKRSPISDDHPYEERLMGAPTAFPAPVHPLPPRLHTGKTPNTTWLQP